MIAPLLFVVLLSFLLLVLLQNQFFF